jgi:hypothetical protein
MASIDAVLTAEDLAWPELHGFGAKDSGKIRQFAHEPPLNLSNFLNMRIFLIGPLDPKRSFERLDICDTIAAFKRAEKLRL